MRETPSAPTDDSMVGKAKHREERRSPCVVCHLTKMQRKHTTHTIPLKSTRFSQLFWRVGSITVKGL